MNRFSLFIVVLGWLAISPRAYAQTESDCIQSTFFCTNTTVSFDLSFPDPDNVPMCPDYDLNYWFLFEVGSNGLSDLVIQSPDMLNGFSLWGPFSAPLMVNACDAASANPSINLTHNVPAVIYNTSNIIGTLPAGYYFLRVNPSECNSSFSLSVRDELTLSCKDLSCENCIGSFTPEPGKKYVLSAWVKEHNAPVEQESYGHPRISIEYPNIPSSEGPFTAGGIIIDGWQRIEFEFTPPLGATFMRIRLSCTTGDCYFDDIRVHPFDGSMKTYVYDPHTLRLMAELDERNYATFYEYDEEGKLVRIKKETERGIMTIQETKTSVVKK